MKKATYICIEGVEGVGKTTQIQLLKKHLEDNGYKVLLTKEPGTDRVPVTMTLRSIVNDGKNEHLFRGLPRELILQSIRGTHLNSDIYPNINDVDFIIQDRGIISGLAYGDSFGLSQELMLDLNNKIVSEKGCQIGINNSFELYDHILFFNSENVAKSLETAINAKQEFEDGDAVENQGSQFMEIVNKNFFKYLNLFKKNNVNVNYINVHKNGIYRSREDILKDVCKILKC